MNRSGRLTSPNMMAVLGIAIMFLSLLLTGFVSVSETRISEAFPINLSEFSRSSLLLLLGVVIPFLFISSFGKNSIIIFSMGLLGSLVPALSLYTAGRFAPGLAADVGPFARVSPSTGFWLTILGSYIVVFACWKKLEQNKLMRASLFIVPVIAILFIIITGQINELSIMKEFANREDRFFSELMRHLLICAGAVGFGAIIGIPLGIMSVRSSRVERPAFAFLNFIQTVPGVALFGLLIAPLAYLSTVFPALRSLGIGGIGWAPAMIALVLYSLLPITRNTFAGIQAISPDTIEAGIGMGMSKAQILARIEIPLSLPVVLAGVRTAAIQAVGNTTMAALIGAGGLGVFIFQGLGQAAMDLVLLGAIPVIMLALLVDGLIQLIIGIVTPRGAREMTDDTA